MTEFKLVSDFALMGDQPAAVDNLCQGLDAGYKEQTLLGVTGTGKTFTMANIIARLAAHPGHGPQQDPGGAAYSSSEFFPENAVEYFVSYYDYYQPEAYIPQTDTYIEKDAAINEEIDRLRHSATGRAGTARRHRRGLVSCIYGLGRRRITEDACRLERATDDPRDDCCASWWICSSAQRHRLQRGEFRVRGDVLEVQAATTASSHARGVLRRRGRADHHRRPAHRREYWTSRDRRHLSRPSNSSRCRKGSNRRWTPSRRS